MNGICRVIAVNLVFAGGVAAGTASAADAEKGRALYGLRCAACHSVEYSGIGPAHKGVYGRRIGSAPGYDYSPALKAASGRWTEESLQSWLTDPERFLPGQKMGVKLESAAERDDVIAYLKSLSSPE